MKYCGCFCEGDSLKKAMTILRSHFDTTSHKRPKRCLLPQVAKVKKKSWSKTIWISRRKKNAKGYSDYENAKWFFFLCQNLSFEIYCIGFSLFFIKKGKRESEKCWKIRTKICRGRFILKQKKETLILKIIVLFPGPKMFNSTQYVFVWAE